MSTRTVVSLGIKIEGASRSFELDIRNRPGLLDADVVIIDPVGLSALWADNYNSNVGYSSMNAGGGANQVHEYLTWLTNQCEELLKAKRIVYVILRPASSIVLHLQSSGTAKSTTFNNYSWLAQVRDRTKSILAAEGERFELLPDIAHPLIGFLRSMKDDFRYFACIAGNLPEAETLATTHAGQPLLVRLNATEGQLFLGPPPRGTGPGKALISACLRLSDSKAHTPKPSWLGAYSIPGTETHEKDVEAAHQEIRTANLHLQEANERLTLHLLPLALLYGQGDDLEDAVRHVLRRFGLDAQAYDDDGLEIDAVINVPAGPITAIAEMEGKLRAVADFEKMRQLHANTSRYFERFNILPRGILFGNSRCADDLTERGDPFTTHVIEFARLQHYKVVNTPDLFVTFVNFLGAKDPAAYAARVVTELFDDASPLFLVPSAT